MALIDYIGPLLLHENRYYIGAKRHRWLFLINTSIFLVFAVFIVVTFGSGWQEMALVLGFYGLLFLIQYLLFDKISDKILYKFIGKKVEMRHRIDDETHSVIKSIEKNPQLAHDAKVRKQLHKK